VRGREKQGPSEEKFMQGGGESGFSVNVCGGGRGRGKRYWEVFKTGDGKGSAVREVNHRRNRLLNWLGQRNIFLYS